ncbi:MAG: diguanylate cyclase [Lachnospiraceae bacterium]|nr:diguanylate cyclase [Lachnospiraceae bacterium]
MAKKANVTNEEAARPITVSDHIELNERNTKKARTTVNDVLKFPVGDQFEKDLTEILESDCEAEGETVVIALVDFDSFMHINQDFGVDAGDKVLIDTGLYIKKNLPKDATVYRIGGDEFGIIFKGDTEREEIFLFLNELKNNFDVKTPDGAEQSITIGMATAFIDASRCAELIRKADGALYRAKTGGRNRVVMAREEKMVPKTSHYTQDQLQRLAKLSKLEGIGEAILLREALDMLLKKYDK